VERDDASADTQWFGLSVAEAEREVRAIESGMGFLPDSGAVYQEWRRIVVEYGVLGVHVHDARPVATMNVHHVKHILTLNVGDFRRFDGVTPLHPVGI
jgi:hypothetical protein